MSTPPRRILWNSLGIGGSAGEVAELTPNLPAAGPLAEAEAAVTVHARAVTMAIRAARLSLAFIAPIIAAGQW
jgi:hypothetical protein